MLFPCNLVNAVEQVGAPKLSFLTMEMFGLWDNSLTVVAYSKEKLLIAPVLSFSKQCSLSFFQKSHIFCFQTF